MSTPWAIPEGLTAIYLGFDWDPTIRLCIHRGPPTGERTHELPEANVEAVTYAMSQTTDKRTLFEGMVRHGVIRLPVDPALTEFCTLLRKHDWTHMMSDDGKVCRRGEAERREIDGRLYMHPEWEPLVKAYEAWIWKKGPKPELPA